MIAIAGSTGQLGRLVIAGLLEKMPHDSLLALARDPAKAADLGIEVREADYDRPETLEPALAGVDTLLLISASEAGRRIVQHANVIAAAKAAGVGLVVYTSILHADRSRISLAEEHRATEAALAESGLPHVVLRNGWYSENYADAIRGALANGVILGCAGEGRISAATRADYAAAIVSVLTGTGHAGKVYELAGDEAFTLAGLAAEVSRQSGKPVAYNDLGEAEYAATLAGFGLPEALAGAIASWDTAIAKGDLFEDGGALSRLAGRPTTPISALVRDIIKAG